MIELVKQQESGIAILLQIDLAGTQAEVKDLVDLEFPEVTGNKGLVISGFPQWAVAAIVAEYKNNVKWIGLVDPKLNPEVKSAVVVWSLSREYRRGDVVPLSICDSVSPA